MEGVVAIYKIYSKLLVVVGTVVVKVKERVALRSNDIREAVKTKDGSKCEVYSEKCFWASKGQTNEINE